MGKLISVNFSSDQLQPKTSSTAWLQHESRLYGTYFKSLPTFLANRQFTS